MEIRMGSRRRSAGRGAERGCVIWGVVLCAANSAQGLCGIRVRPFAAEILRCAQNDRGGFLFITAFAHHNPKRQRGELIRPASLTLRAFYVERTLRATAQGAGDWPMRQAWPAPVRA